MSKAGRKLTAEYARVISAELGMVTKSAALSDILAPLCEAVVKPVKVGRKIARLERMVAALMRSEAPPMPRPAGFEPLTADYVTELRRLTNPPVNGTPVPFVQHWGNGNGQG